MYALPVLKEGCPGGGWAGSCTDLGWRVGRCNAQVRHQSQAGAAVPACTAPGQRAQHTWPTLPVQECSVTGGNRNQIPPGNSGKAYPAKGARRKPGINRSLSN